jgi:hypothetical protein
MGGQKKRSLFFGWEGRSVMKQKEKWKHQIEAEGEAELKQDRYGHNMYVRQRTREKH